MLFRIFFVLSVVAIVAEAGDSHIKPKTTSTSKPPTTTTESTTTESTTTPLWTTETTHYPTYPIIYPHCCGENEIYLPPRIAPHCNVYCNDIGKECHRRLYDIIPNPDDGCFCKPGFCKNKFGKCISFYEAFIKCH